ncbi:MULTISPECIES: MSMEG_1061 family FMN-dependent PPOX-type flavoprotein [unclassified Caballeronia]|uniref:MSMEG_1061 family FMN-dependent PPOX-type flavoprotein n=1 Tax=unclassified Caballeronia TaxID=2646786 RepID=UPI00285D4FC7|nr:MULTISPECIES: MSMEG_1061 family FMN-dependent PPOX-type flavoprotein [unclassified Caballeronia]MDR5777264.1 pyridoxamine 5'-phosphate oxidase family protein [Caballeronia sp. LZ002]MDR5852702.1 pyridoxamine 5'-phosphate oxidase family protein [Caballeronia sp. LZ003]
MSSAALDASDLDRLYDQPSEFITKGVLPRLLPFHLAYLRVASFFCLATGNTAGLDASPRGGQPGFVHALDEKHVVFADWPGNNRIASLRNLTEDDRVGMLFLFPGLEVFMRINGRATITDDPAVLGRFAEGTKTPKTAIVVTIDEVLFHCGKAINRAKLWSDASRLDRSSVPSPGEMKAAMAEQDANIVRTIDDAYYQSVRNNLY